ARDLRGDGAGHGARLRAGRRARGRGRPRVRAGRLLRSGPPDPRRRPSPGRRPRAGHSPPGGQTRVPRGAPAVRIRLARGAFSFLVGLAVAVVLHYALFRMTLPVEPFIYMAF